MSTTMHSESLIKQEHSLNLDSNCLVTRTAGGRG